MKAFRSAKARLDSENEVSKKIGVLFGYHNEDILWDYFWYLSGKFKNKVSSLSNTEIYIEDVRNVIERSLYLKNHYGLNNDYLYIGNCEMYHYFFNYNEESLINNEAIKYVAVDHELGEIGHKVGEFSEWFGYNGENLSEL
jgi:hypothetical protein